MIQLLGAACVSTVLITGLYCVVKSGRNDVASLNSNTQDAIHIFQSLPDTPSQKNRMDAMINTPSIRDKVRHVSLSTVEQREYLAKFGHECYGHAENQILERYDEFASGLEHLQTEVWKFCALYREGGIYIDSQSSALMQTLGDLVHMSSSTSAKLERNYALVFLKS